MSDLFTTATGMPFELPSPACSPSKPTSDITAHIVEALEDMAIGNVPEVSKAVTNDIDGAGNAARTGKHGRKFDETGILDKELMPRHEDKLLASTDHCKVQCLDGALGTRLSDFVPGELFTECPLDTMNAAVADSEPAGQHDTKFDDVFILIEELSLDRDNEPLAPLDRYKLRDLDGSNEFRILDLDPDECTTEFDSSPKRRSPQRRRPEPHGLGLEILDRFGNIKLKTPIISPFMSKSPPVDGSDESPEARHPPDTPQVKICAPSCSATPPLIQIIPPEELARNPPAYLSPLKGKVSELKYHKITAAEPRGISMIYNEYGELVHEKSLQHRPTTDELSVTQILRAIKKAYHHDLRHKLGKFLIPTPDGKSSMLVDDGIWKDRLSSWDFQPRSTSMSPVDACMAVTPSAHSRARRVLEIGCSDGNWCFDFKKKQPDWIVEGIDDTDHWSCIVRNTPRDTTSTTPGNIQDYFAHSCEVSQEVPEFTVRNLNSLLVHEAAMPHDQYEFIRAREIFDRVESYKNFLDDIRHLLKPDGVVEFLEVDPRPRALAVGWQVDDSNEHKSGPETDWTEKIADRFKDPFDEEIAKTVPGWTARVAERSKANLRPRDGVPAANLKSWLEGVGFWDVKQLVLPIPVGGKTRSGQILKDFVLYQIALENEIPKLRDAVPAIEIDAIESGHYYMNLHIVTGRKPCAPRPGDLLKDGTRQEMTASTYDAMARFHAVKTSQWKRIDLELSKMMNDLTSLPGGPEMFTLARTKTDEKLFQGILGRHSQLLHTMQWHDSMLSRLRNGRGGNSNFISGNSMLTIELSRIDLELSKMMNDLTSLPGGPEMFTLARTKTDEKLFQGILGRHSQSEGNPFNAPPFMTMEEMPTRERGSGKRKTGNMQSPRLRVEFETTLQRVD